MSSEKFYLTREEQEFLKEWFETDDLEISAERFVYLLTIEGVSGSEMQVYMRKIIERLKSADSK